MIIKKSFKYRLYPTKTQEVLLNKHFGCVRFVWNQFVDSFNKREETPTSTELRRTEEFFFLKEVSAGAIQQKERDFREFKTQFFSTKRKNKLGFPKFKKKGVSNDSFRLPNQKFVLEGSRLKLEKIGKVEIVVDREPTGRALSVTVSKDKTGCFFASILVETEVQPKPSTGRSVGVDLGIKQLITTSDGLQVKMFTENQSEQKHLQKILSRKVKGSSRYRRVKLRLAKVHKKVAARRTWLLHNISSFLVTNYDTIVLEDLNVSGMMKNHKLARAIQNQAWTQLVHQLSYKAKWFGSELIRIGRFFPSSKLCSRCGCLKDDLTLSDRTYTCDCGLRLDRDLNAAINILAEGVDSAQTVIEGMSDSDSRTFVRRVGAVPAEMTSFLIGNT